MKHLLLIGALAAFLAAPSFAQTSIVVTDGGLVVTATSGDIHCVFVRIPTIDPLHVSCFKGKVEVVNENVIVLLDHTVTGHIDTPDGNFISWILTHPGPGVFQWNVDAFGDQHIGVF